MLELYRVAAESPAEGTDITPLKPTLNAEITDVANRLIWHKSQR
jgi:hypothetical protein